MTTTLHVGAAASTASAHRTPRAVSSPVAVSTRIDYPELALGELHADRFQRAREVLDVALQEPPLGVADPDERRRIISEVSKTSS